MKQELRLRTMVLDPPPGVTLMMQRGRSELHAPSHVSDGEVVFEFTVTVADISDVAAPFDWRIHSRTTGE